MAYSKQDIIEEIKSQLGHPHVRLEIYDYDEEAEEEFETFIDKAVRRLQPYLDMRSYMTVSVQDSIDLSDEPIDDILRIIPAQATMGEDFDVFHAHRYKNLHKDFDDFLIAQRRLSEIKSVIQPSFKFDEGILYLSGFAGKVTIEYYKEPEFQDLDDPKWVEWVSDYALAMAKIKLGRIRSKFDADNQQYQLDGDTLLQEGKEEKEKLVQQLGESASPFFATR